MAYHPNPTPYHPFMHAFTHHIALQLSYTFFLLFSFFLSHLYRIVWAVFLVVVYAFFLLQVYTYFIHVCLYALSVLMTVMTFSIENM
jgi:hypothetical protein